MSYSNRLRNYAIGLATGLIIAISVAYVWLWNPASTQDARIGFQTAEYAQEYQGRADNPVECLASTLSDRTKAQCLEEERQAARESQRIEYDLEAQQTMAVWTRAMGKAAIIGTGVGIVGLLLIFTTFWETRQAAESAGKTYNAFIKAEKPTLVPSISSIQQSTSTNDGKTRKTVQIEIANIGKGDAVLKGMTWGFSDLEEGPSLLSGPPRTKTIKGGGEWQLGFVKSNLSPDIAETLIVMLKYESVFSPDHITRRRWLIKNGVAHERPLSDGPPDR